MQHILNNFFYGELGNRIASQRTSEIFQNSCKSLNNFVITDLGTLKVAKQFKQIDTRFNNIKKVIETQEDTYLILTDETIYNVYKETLEVKGWHDHNLKNIEKLDAVLVDKTHVIVYDNSEVIRFYDLYWHPSMKQEDFHVKKPIRNKKILQLDIWRVSKDPVETSKFRIVQMSSFANPLIKADKDGKIYLHNSTTQIKRIYTTYNAAVDIDYFDKVADGDLYGILRVDYTDTNEKGAYILDNRKCSLGPLTEDAKYKGKYCSTLVITPSKPPHNDEDTVEGEFAYGELEDIDNFTNKIAYHQDRLIIVKDNEIFFSKKNDYKNFRNGVNDDDAFFLQLNPIANRRGELIDFISFGSKLYVITTAGIYIFNGNLTPTNAGMSVIIGTDSSVTSEFQLIDNVLYFINSSNVLKAMLIDRESQQISFNTFTVDKFSTKNLFKEIYRLEIDDRTYLAARSIDDNQMYLIEQVDFGGMFRKTSIDFKFTSKLHCINKFIFDDNHFYRLSDKSYKHASVSLNPLSLKGDSILCDNNSKVTSVSVKLINEDREAIEGVKINSTNIQNLGNEVEDSYSIYRIKTNFNVRNGFNIDVFTKENDKTCELQTIQIASTVTEDV